MVDVLSAIKTSLSITDQLLKTTHSCVVAIVTQHRKDAALKSKLTHFEMHLVAMNQVLHCEGPPQVGLGQRAFCIGTTGSGGHYGQSAGG